MHLTSPIDSLIARGCAMRVQALRATRELHANIAAEHRAMHDFYATWHAILSPHQEMRAELAAWPNGVFPFRLIRFLGAPAPSFRVRSCRAGAHCC